MGEVKRPRGPSPLRRSLGTIFANESLLRLYRRSRGVSVPKYGGNSRRVRSPYFDRPSLDERGVTNDTLGRGRGKRETWRPGPPHPDVFFQGVQGDRDWSYFYSIYPLFPTY